MGNRCVKFFTIVMGLCMIQGYTAATAADGLLIHWNFDQGQQAAVKDLSGHGLDGPVGAGWVESPVGQAAMMDGTSKSTVSVKIPEALRFGKASWTFMAMVKPITFGIDSAQNQRRLFAFGTYPDAYLVIDIQGTGHMNCYFCYKDSAGKVVSAGGSSSMRLSENQWAHIALVCDRDRQLIAMYVNGYSPEAQPLPGNFDGDFALGGLTVGNAWQNYWGLVDEIKIHRSALTPEQIEAEFDRLKGPFKVVESEAATAAKKQIRLEKVFADVNAAWTGQDYTAVRSLCLAVVGAADAPAHFRSYAQLRMAQSYAAEGNQDAAREIYVSIAANDAYPPVHREEAKQSAQELDPVSQRPASDTENSTRTRIPDIATFAAEVFVSTRGDDNNTGSVQSPLATLTRARDAVRALRKRGVTGAIAVTVLPGQYSVQKALTLTAEDSGSPEGPVVYRARDKGTVVFYGGAVLSGFEQVTNREILNRLPAGARGKVQQCDLKALGITEYGQLKVRGFAQPPSPPTLELYVDRVPMTLARWPNQGFLGITRLLKSGSPATGEPSAFEYKSDRHARWTSASDAWLFGYFHYLWADATIKIGRIDPAARTLTTAEPYRYGSGGMSTEQGIQYYAFNLLEEIDVPGEWYLERSTGMLYLYPPSDPGQSTVEIGMLSTPMITLDQVSHVRIEGLTFDLARYNGIVATNANHCTFIGCTVSRLAGNGIMIHGGTDNRLIGCDIHTLGRRGTEIIGGDRATLTPGSHLVENCWIHDFGRIDRTYTPAIQLEGVGHRIAHNLMVNGPSSAMRIEGNDHVIEYNEVHSMVQESDDQGALELFRNPTYRGVVFRHNYLHHIGKTGKEAAVHGQAAIRFDDAISGMLVYGNVFYRCANGNFGAIQMNSGRDNLMDNNMFIDCKQGISGGWYPGNSVWTSLRQGQKPEGFYRDALYLARYPRIATMLDDPGINHLWRNVFYRCGKVATRTANIDQFENGVFEDDPGFVDAENGNFSLREDVQLFRTMCFKPIPFERIGLYDAPSRATWPVTTTPVDMPDWRLQAGH
ncbi:MAG: right-handed parallel beta-helix repeat-containing protein [Phycisphaerae bacterium]|nr:right-handed parallel beta-helix repeat-containing protein [Phycisphaerae bacterium]